MFFFSAIRQHALVKVFSKRFHACCMHPIRWSTGSLALPSALAAVWRVPQKVKWLKVPWLQVDEHGFVTASLPVQAGDKVWILVSRFATNVVSLQQAADWRQVPYVFKAAQRAELSFALVVWDVAKVVPHVVAAVTSQPDEVVVVDSSAHPCRSIPTEAKSIAVINCVKDMAAKRKLVTLWTRSVTCYPTGLSQKMRCFMWTPCDLKP